MRVEFHLVDRQEIPTEHEIIHQVPDYSAVRSKLLVTNFEVNVDDPNGVHCGPIYANGLALEGFELVVLEFRMSSKKLLRATGSGAA